MNTDRDLMQQALEALERYNGVDQRACDAEEALRERLAKKDCECGDRAALTEPRPIQECYGDCPTNPQTCPNPCNFEGRPKPVQQPEQEPMAWADMDVRGEDKGLSWTPGHFHKTPLYTSPTASKPWVGLTGHEVNEFAAGCHLGNSVQDAIRKAEAKLREKNA